MRRNHLLYTALILIIIIFHGTAFGQLGVQKGIKLGYNWAKLTDVNTTQSLKAMTGGISIEFNFLNILSLQTDILYSPRGSIINDTTKISLKYLSIPVILKRKFFPVGIHPYLLIGPEINFLLSANMDGVNIKDTLNKEDFSIVTGAGIEFSLLGKGTYIEGRYCFGLNSIYSDRTAPDSKNRVYQIFVGVLF